MTSCSLSRLFFLVIGCGIAFIYINVMVPGGEGSDLAFAGWMLVIGIPLFVLSLVVATIGRGCPDRSLRILSWLTYGAHALGIPLIFMPELPEWLSHTVGRALGITLIFYLAAYAVLCVVMPLTFLWQRLHHR